MNPHRLHTIRHAWDDYQMGDLSRREAEAIELRMLDDQRRERERLAQTTVIVDCARCGAPITVSALAYRGEHRHACPVCIGGGTAWPLFVEDEEVSA